MGICCAVVGCFSSEREKLRAFFRFPKRLVLCRQWIIAAGRPDLESKDIETIHKSYRICDLHFDRSQRFKKKLKLSAIPTLNLPETPEGISQRTKGTQTEIDKRSCSNQESTSIKCETDTETMQNTSRKRKLSYQSQGSPKRELILIKEENTNSSSEEKEESEFVAAYKRIEYIKKYLKSTFSGDVYDVEYNNFVMNLYFASPLGYRFLSKALNLPNEKLLRRKNIDVGTRLSDGMIKCLKYKSQRFSNSDKICVLSVSRMDLKSEIYRQVDTERVIGFHEINGWQTTDIAKYVVVIMARGLFSQWTQPIAFCFLKQVVNFSEVTKWVLDIIAKIIGIGFNVVAVTSDQESFFFNLTKTRYQCVIAQPCFLINDNKIYCIFDTPHIINMFRNFLMNNNFVFRDGSEENLIASWDDMQSLYNLDKNRTYRIALNITHLHIKPRVFERTAVKYAAQVFSKSVAVALQCYVEFGKLPTRVLGTAAFAQRMNDVFDMLNSVPTNDTYKYKQRFSGERFQILALQDFIRLLNSVRVVSKTNRDVTLNTKCINDLKLTIHALLLLSVDLKNRGFEHFFTRRLNTDVIKKFFKCVRQKRGVCREPTPFEFCVEFKKHFLNAAIDTHNIKNASQLDKLFKAIEEVYNKYKVKNEVIKIESCSKTEHESNQNILETIEVEDEQQDVEDYIDYSIVKIEENLEDYTVFINDIKSD